MTSFLSKLVGSPRAKPPSLICERPLWSAGAAELRSRTLDGRRESGAFLLGVEEGSSKRILDFVFYDDVDPNALSTGIVHFDGTKFPKLWEICRSKGYGVVADVHVHPGSYGQSPSDRANPVMPRAGHYALIIPDFGTRRTEPGGIGMYEYRGEGRWITRTGEGQEFFRLDVA
jgi:hypothetical protein